MYVVKESDWRKFRAKLPGWQEAYMQRLNEEYIAILSTPGNASEKFWALEKRIREDKKSVGMAASMTRSDMDTDLMSLLLDGVITMADLDDFSEEQYYDNMVVRDFTEERGVCEYSG